MPGFSQPPTCCGPSSRSARTRCGRRHRRVTPGSRFFGVGRGWAIAGAAGLAMVLVALIGGRLREQAPSPSVGTRPHAVHVVASGGHGARLRTDRLSGRTPYRVHGRQRRFDAAPVRAVARLARCHGHRWDRRSEAAVLVARRHVARVFCPRQTDESGGRRRRAGRTSAMRRTGRAARGVPRGRSCSAPT